MRVLEGSPLQARLYQAPALGTKHAQCCRNIPFTCVHGIVPHILAKGMNIACLADAAKLALAIEQPVKVMVGLGPAAK